MSLLRDPRRADSEWTGSGPPGDGPAYEGSDSHREGGNAADYKRINYRPGLVPSPGDIVVFHEDPAPAEGTGSAGHVDVFLSGDASGFTGFDQNWGTPKYCRKVRHDYAAVAGWLHPSHLGLRELPARLGHRGWSAIGVSGEPRLRSG